MKTELFITSILFVLVTLITICAPIMFRQSAIMALIIVFVIVIEYLVMLLIIIAGSVIKDLRGRTGRRRR